MYWNVELVKEHPSSFEMTDNLGPCGYGDAGIEGNRRWVVAVLGAVYNRSVIHVLIQVCIK